MQSANLGIWHSRVGVAIRVRNRKRITRRWQSYDTVCKPIICSSCCFHFVFYDKRARSSWKTTVEHVQGSEHTFSDASIFIHTLIYMQCEHSDANIPKWNKNNHFVASYLDRFSFFFFRKQFQMFHLSTVLKCRTFL